jgi:tRNA(fMet)-specific endonuclease VapC
MPPLHYLLDTNIVSAVIRQPDCAVAKRLAGMSRDTFCISIVVAAELRFGVFRKASAKLAKQVETVLEGIDIIPMEEPVDLHYGSIRAELSRRGLPIGQNDLFIAAHARALGLVLVTDNVREFARVPDLAIENWLETSADGS